VKGGRKKRRQDGQMKNIRNKLKDRREGEKNKGVQIKNDGTSL
jgi:hypothetical protein